MIEASRGIAISGYNLDVELPEALAENRIGGRLHAYTDDAGDRPAWVGKTGCAHSFRPTVCPWPSFLSLLKRP